MDSGKEGEGNDGREESLDLAYTLVVEEKAFFRAVKNGDLAAVRELLSKEPELAHAVDEDKSTGLHYAAWKGHATVIDALVDAGADIHAHNENWHWGTTPLHGAAHGNHALAAAALIKHGADVNALKSNGEGRPLGETKIHRATAAAKVLKAAGAVE